MHIHCNVAGVPTDRPLLVADADGVIAWGNLAPGRCSFSVPDTVNGGFTIQWNGQSARSVFPPYPRQANYEGGLLEPPIPTLTHDPLSLGRLYVDGYVFRRVSDHGHEVVRLHSDFKLLKLLLDGVDIDPILDQRFKAGSKGPRIFGTCAFLFELDPRRIGSAYWDALEELGKKLIARGGYGELTVFTDQQMDLFNGMDRQQHWRETCERTQDGPWILELVNEWFKNGINPTEFDVVPNGCPQSPGSFVDGMGPPNPAWSARPNTYNTFHDSRGWKWPVTMGVTSWELRRYPGGNVATLCNEPIGAASYDQEGKRTTGPPELFEKKGRDCATWAAGAVFHSQSGLSSLLWNDVERACGEALFRGLRQ